MNDAQKEYDCSNSCWKCSIQLWIGIVFNYHNKNALYHRILPAQQQSDIIKTVSYQWTSRGIYYIVDLLLALATSVPSNHTSSAARWARRGIHLIKYYTALDCRISSERREIERAIYEREQHDNHDNEDDISIFCVPSKESLRLVHTFWSRRFKGDAQQ